MRKTSLIVFAVLILMCISGCERPETADQLTKLEQKIKALEADAKKQTEFNSIVFKGIHDSNNRMSDGLGFITERVLKSEFEANPAVIDLSGKGYATLDSGMGILLISCEDAQPYLDGHRLKLRIGNPLYMRFSGFTLTFKTGRRPPEIPTKVSTQQGGLGAFFQKWRKDSQEWKDSLKQSEESFAAELDPGSWTTVEATLSQTKPEDIGYMEVTISTSKVSLTPPK